MADTDLAASLGRIEELLSNLLDRFPGPAAPPSNTTPSLSPYLTVPEAADYLRKTSHGIYSLVHRGRIVPMPGSGRLLFRREELDRYLKSRPRR